MPVRFWSTRSSLERVDLYTRLSLYGIHALFVVFVLLAASGDDDVTARGLALAGLLGVLPNVAAVLALRSLVVAPEPPWRWLTLLGVSSVAAYAVMFALDDEVRPAAVLLIALALAFGLGGIRDTRVSYAVIALCAALTWIPTQDLAVVGTGTLYAAVFVSTLRASIWVLDVMHELDDARGAQAALAVAEERLRFSRDVHDVLGRQLSTIAVQADLAATLADRGDPTAGQRMLDVRATAHTALREARELARGYRSASLEQEVDGARSLLRSAGIELTADLAGLPEEWREPAAWVVREATTNVLRHSSASAVAVSYADGVLAVANDRPNPVNDTGTGTGLTGLGERLEPIGATLGVDHAPDTFTVRVTFPEGGPA
jgi:two-component system sensor histidine kinase DesK